MTPYLLILAVLLGIAPGLIAHSKGRNFFLWWAYGVVLGPVALLHAILLRRYTVPSPFAPSPERPRMRWRSHWPAVLWAATSVAIAIIAVTVYGLFSSSDFSMSMTGPTATQTADRARDTDRAPMPPSQPPAATATGTAQPAPTVRVTLRRDPPPEEKVEAAPVARVERMVSGDSPAPAAPAANPASKLERTAPVEPEKAPVVVAERTAPAETTTPAISPPAAQAQPAAPKVAAVAPAAPVAEPKPAIPQPPAEKQQASRTESEAPAPKPAPSDVVAVGDTVRVVQIALAKRGYDAGPANGRAGSKTQAAIRQFQADRNLEQTGAIDYTLLESLGIVGPRVHAFRPPPGMTVGR